MQIITLAEAKEFLSIDFDTKDNEITIRVNAIESYLFHATGLEFNNSNDSSKILNLAKDYVLTKLYLEYYPTENSQFAQLKLTNIMKQLQVLAKMQ